MSRKILERTMKSESFKYAEYDLRKDYEYGSVSEFKLINTCLYSQKELKYKDGVYIIKNKNTGFWYVGSSWSIRQRIQQHLSALINGKHQSKVFQREFEKSDKENWIVTLIEENKVLNDNEKTIFNRKTKEDKYLNEYLNEHKELSMCSSLSAFTSFGVHHTEESKKKISDFNKGKTMSQESRNKMSESKKGISRDKATKNKVSESLKGKSTMKTKRKVVDIYNKHFECMTDACEYLNCTLDELIEYNTKHQKGVVIGKIKPTFVVIDDVQYDCIKDAAEAMGFKPPTIKAKCRDPKVTNYNYKV